MRERIRIEKPTTQSPRLPGLSPAPPAAGQVLFAQELDARGALKGEPLAITGNVLEVNGAVASLPDGRWLVVTREQTDTNNDTCSERLFGTVLDGG